MPGDKNNSTVYLPSIHPFSTSLKSVQDHGCRWSISQLPRGERPTTPWACRRSVAGHASKEATFLNPVHSVTEWRLNSRLKSGKRTTAPSLTPGQCSAPNLFPTIEQCRSIYLIKCHNNIKLQIHQTRKAEMLIISGQTASCSESIVDQESYVVLWPLWNWQIKPIKINLLRCFSWTGPAALAWGILRWYFKLKSGKKTA